MRRLALIPLVLIALLAAVAIPSAHGATAGAAAKKTCIVHRYTAAGKKVVFRVSVYRYKKVRRHGKRVRIIVKRKVALRGSCSPTRACVRVKVSGGKATALYARRRVLTRVKRGNQLVMRRVVTRVPVLGKCVKPSSSPDADLGVPLRITVLPGSFVHMDFGAFQRDAPITGTIKGYSPQLKIDITKDIPVVLTDGTIAIGSTPIYIDGDCGGRQTASLRTGKSAVAVLDGSKESTGLLSTTGAVTANTFLQVRLPLELRDGETGCDKPYIDTQYSSWPLHVTLAGKIDPKTGLTKLHLTSAPVLATDLSICLNPGLQSEPCTGYLIPLPIYLAADVLVRVDLNPK
jgi:hypothetical protein